MPKIFISYRRQDTNKETSSLIIWRIRDRLRYEFGKDAIFLDLDNIKPGDKWEIILTTAVTESEVIIPVIGSDWVRIIDTKSDDAEDYVRFEIELGLRLEKRFFPVLVMGAVQPQSAEYPTDTMRNLNNYQFLRISDGSVFDSDIEKLIEAIRTVIPKSTPDNILNNEHSKPTTKHQTAELNRLIDDNKPSDLRHTIQSRGDTGSLSERRGTGSLSSTGDTGSLPPSRGTASLSSTGDTGQLNRDSRPSRPFPPPKKAPSWIIPSLIGAVLIVGAFGIFFLGSNFIGGDSTPTLAAQVILEPTATDTAEPTATDTAEPTATNTAEPTASDTAEPTASDTAEPTATNTAEPTVTNTSQPTATDTLEPTVTPDVCRISTNIDNIALRIEPDVKSVATAFLQNRDEPMLVIGQTPHTWQYGLWWQVEVDSYFAPVWASNLVVITEGDCDSVVVVQP